MSSSFQRFAVHVLAVVALMLIVTTLVCVVIAAAASAQLRDDVARGGLFVGVIAFLAFALGFGLWVGVESDRHGSQQDARREAEKESASLFIRFQRAGFTHIYYANPTITGRGTLDGDHWYAGVWFRNQVCVEAREDENGLDAVASPGAKTMQQAIEAALAKLDSWRSRSA